MPLLLAPGLSGVRLDIRGLAEPRIWRLSAAVSSSKGIFFCSLQKLGTRKYYFVRTYQVCSIAKHPHGQERYAQPVGALCSVVDNHLRQLQRQLLVTIAC